MRRQEGFGCNGGDNGTYLGFGLLYLIEHHEERVRCLKARTERASPLIQTLAGRMSESRTGRLVVMM